MKYIYILVLAFVMFGCGETVHTPTVREADNVLLLNIPASVVDLERLNGYLSQFDLKIPHSFLNPWDKKIVLENVDKLKNALKHAPDPADERLLFALHVMLGKEYMELGYFHEDTEALHEAKKHTRTAIEAVRNKAEFETDLALAKSNLALIYLYSGEGERAFDIFVHLIEQYQDVGIGDHPQWFAVQHAKYLSSSANRYTEGDDQHPYAQRVFEYFNTLLKNESHDEHVRAVAAIELYDYYYRTGAPDEAEGLRPDIDMLIKKINYENIKQRWDIVLTRAEYHRIAREID
jgi:tetratricopeptide (TPR) repeat protein